MGSKESRKSASPIVSPAALRAQAEATLQELVKSRDELAAARDRYHQLYDLTPVAHLTLDRRGGIKEANLTAARLLRTDRASLLDRPLSSFMRGADADAFQRHLLEVFASSVKRGCDLELVAGPRRVPVHIDSIAMQDGVECRSVLIDLTDLREAQAGRRAWRERSEALVDTVADAIVSSDERGRIESFNKAAERLFGYAEAEVLGQGIQVLMPSPYREEHELYIGGPNREILGLKKDGTHFPLELGIGEWWDHGQRKFTAIFHDLTAHKQAEAEARENVARFRQIAEHVGDVFAVHDRRRRGVVYVNPAFETVWGRKASELLESGTGWLAWVHPDDRARAGDSYRRFIASPVPQETEFRILRPSGEVRWVHARNFPVVDPDGNVHHDVAVVQDITNQKKLEEELRQVQKMEALGGLASGVAHDFNNVLQAILGCVNIASLEPRLPARSRQFLERAVDAAKRGGDLAGQLMAFTRKQAVAPQAVQLDALIKRMGGLVERLVTEQVSVEIETRAPDASVWADPVQIEQILMNLAANARDAMPEGGVLSIRTDAVDWGDATAQRHVRLVVEDSGTGMDERTRARVFEPFFTTKEVGKGTGLGLSTVFTVTRQLGGHIEVDSEKGRGSRFTLYLPCHVAAGRAQDARAREAVRFRGTALLVEDEPVIRATIRLYLEELGLDVLEAGGADEALAFCEGTAGPLDLLVSDIVMPTMRGPRLAELLRQRYPQLHVLFISASPALAGDEAAAVDTVPVLQKPFGLEELAERLEELMGAGDVERPSPSGAPKTILLVEDDDDSRLVISVLLQGHGYRVLEAASPSQALELVAEDRRPIDLMLSDVRLPKMGGQELATEVCRSRPDLRVVFMSGLPSSPDLSWPFVRKPIDLDDLVAVLEKTMAPP